MEHRVTIEADITVVLIAVDIGVDCDLPVLPRVDCMEHLLDS